MAETQPSSARRKKAVRYGIPVAVAGVAAATVGLVPALATAGSPDLPDVTAEQLVAKMASSNVQHLSGTVKTTADLGLPAMPGAGGSGSGEAPGAGQQQGGGSPFGGGSGGPHGGGDRGGSADPQQKLTELASGTHTLQVAADGPQKQRVSLVEKAAEYSFIHHGKDAWAYDSSANAVHHSTVPDAPHTKGAPGQSPRGPQDATPQQAAQQALKAVKPSSSVSVDGTQNVAGRDAYQLVVAPKGKGAADSTVQSVRIAVDGKTGVPLKFTLTPKGGGKPVIDSAFTKVDFDKPDAGTFDFSPPKGAKVTEDKAKQHAPGKPGKPGQPGGKQHPDMSGLNVIGQGWGSVAQLQGPKGGLGSPKAPNGSNAQAGQLLDGLTEEAKGDFGTGRVFSTRLVNALITDDGKVYVGAVSKEGLVKAANQAAK